MLDPNIIRANPELIEKTLKRRGWQADVRRLQALHEQYRRTLQSVEKSRAEIKERSKTKTAEANLKILRADKMQLKKKEKTLERLKIELEAALKELPNLLKDDVPDGRGESDNIVLRTVGEPPRFSFSAKDYLTIAAKHDLIDLERAAKVSGSRFYYLKNEAALLSLALVHYGLDIAISEGFAPVLPPVLIGEEAMSGMGYLEHGEDKEIYHLPKDNLYLVGTSEQSIGPMHMGEIIDGARLPLRYVAFSTCFRREAGSYGKDTKGILRVHQFDKLEMFSITTPEQSEQEHEYLLSLQEKFVKGLGLPYRVVKLCAGDLGGPSARTYDIETWIPSQGRYRETHSTSTTTDFQSRRLHIRYRQTGGSAALVHMLNGTMAAVNRPLIAILECGQRADGTVDLPPVLQPYLFGKTRIG
ncbi:serine--tRNA ligase [Candidatus Uhrbacteria bacterium RIFCSPLOWO2_02_FULL_48_12]|uniref:Serine--tRNA ligase n=1 Tax=Candidatus Uhrbacteria bacterium RIFCSPLOWO2_02_FULL_48_12 TaxID=1802407 RepID=A0A1F7VAF6_9BACT|nr:MAG: serine--tRNA ligase [Candidatus Uhrbacteria bacterium RIFCSPLOWO2_02_FULL_48_12]